MCVYRVYTVCYCNVNLALLLLLLLLLPLLQLVLLQLLIRVCNDAVRRLPLIDSNFRQHVAACMQHLHSAAHTVLIQLHHCITAFSTLVALSFS
jgi:hypothetical protein